MTNHRVTLSREATGRLEGTANHHLLLWHMRGMSLMADRVSGKRSPDQAQRDDVCTGDEKPLAQINALSAAASTGGVW
jgi:hypothetical protein